MALTDEEKTKVRRYLGYLNVTAAGSIALGVPSASQPLFIVESSMNRVLPEGESILREYLTELDCIEAQIKESRRKRQSVAQVGDVKMRGAEELDVLYEELGTWACRLSDLLAAPINPQSELHRRIYGATSVAYPT